MTTTYIGRHRRPEASPAVEATIRRIERAYNEAHLGMHRTSHLPIATIRAMVDADRATFDEAIKILSNRLGVHVRAEADRKTLTAADHDAAVVLGGTPRHLLLIIPDPKPYE